MNKYKDGYYVLSKNSNIDEPYHWVLKAPNHEVILTSENYVNKHGALNGIESVRKNCKDDSNYRRLTAADGSPYFNLLAKNYEVIGTSEMYSSEQARDHGIEAVKEYGATMVMIDETIPGGDNGDTTFGLSMLGSSSSSNRPIITSKPEKNKNAGRYA